MATFAYNHGNLCAAALTSAITTTATSITVDSTDAETFPSVRFYATICPVGQTPNSTNSEVVLVTARSGGTLTVTRAQRSTTAKAFSAGAIIMNGVYTQDLDYAQSVGKTIFSATNVSITTNYSNWNIDSDMLPTAPVNGMVIRVVFGANTSGPAARLRLNSGTYYYVYAGAGITADATNVVSQTSFNPKSSVVYELAFNGSAWYALNVPAQKSITSDNIDYATLVNKIYPVGSIYMSATLSTAAQVKAIFGGTWVAWGSGRVPVGVNTSDTNFSTVEKTGGEKTHTLTKAELPKIEGTLPHTAYGETKVSGVFSFASGSVSNYEGANSDTMNNKIYKMSFGSGTAHNNLQPYITCYMYKRTA